MITLAINTSCPKTAIALFKEQDGKLKLLDEASWKSKNDEAENLVPKIAKLLKKNKKNFEEIKNLIVVKGPGSFTGLRIGVATANMISYLNKAHLYCLTAFDFYWKMLGEKPENMALLLFAGSGGVYVNGELVNLPDLKKYLKEKKVKEIFGDISKDQKKEIKNLKFKTLRKSFGKVLEKFELKDFEKTQIVEPLYIKTPGITPSKNKLFK
ncbi:tRNA (adenosine(37)-N6)-threonylcarbamoyltransferase complex dimerization subunit type 1 TsaB [Candidatus Gracilibacteria bacterium]|nr:tRNA (adenosine(37)-N6)-threonylcarbamoyltransferase complex dimerization subunit type 1 TsaB [Candidatus Gracilibacteria bacterium]